MQQIATAQAAEGMVLAKDVVIDGNRILCGRETVLSAAIIERFKRMEINHITVEGHPVPEEGAKSLKEELLAIEKRFSKVKHIKPLVYLKKRLQEKMIASRAPVGDERREKGKRR